MAGRPVLPYCHMVVGGRGALGSPLASRHPSLARRLPSAPRPPSAIWQYGRTGWPAIYIYIYIPIKPYYSLLRQDGRTGMSAISWGRAC